MHRKTPPGGYSWNSSRSSAASAAISSGVRGLRSTSRFKRSAAGPPPLLPPLPPRADACLQAGVPGVEWGCGCYACIPAPLAECISVPSKGCSPSMCH
jgi:hypothetical protein